MTTSYVKEKATNTVLTATSGQDQNNPIHVEAINNFVTSRRWSLDDYEIGFTDDNVVAEWIKAQDEATKTYADKRKAEYPPLEDVTIALAEKAEGRSEMWDEITAKRATVRTKYPKP
jgi:hypothetical protein|tara:strand:+ start:691 stop:1041 length:351 start_codon:yes stop_codon:yes gene_type:complete